MSDELNPITGLPIVDEQPTEPLKLEPPKLTPEQSQKILDDFIQTRRRASFSARNPQLGPMIKCPVCQRRHRDNESCTIKYAVNAAGEPMIAEPKRLNLHPNPYGWRLKRGRMVWFNTLKKYVKID